MSSPIFGMEFPQNKVDIVPTIGHDFSETLVIETSDDASAIEFPIDAKVRMSTSDPDAMAALGTGALKADIQAIHDQLDGLNSGASVTVVRVTEETTPEATAANIVNVINSLETIPDETFKTPHIVLAGRTSWRDGENSNPVIAALEANLGKILAISPVQLNDTSLAAAIADREKINSERIMPIGVAARVYEGENIVTRSMAGRVAGLFIRVDNNLEGKPFDPIANQNIYGLAGLSRKVPFSMLNGSVEGQQLLAADISTVAAGQIGKLGAASKGGYRFIGTDNAGTSELFAQIHQIRGIDYIITQLIEITNEFLGKRMTLDLVEAWLNSIAFMLRDHKAAGRILGNTPKAEMFIPDQNSPENIRLGRLKLDIGIEPAPAFRLAVHEIKRYRPAVEGFVSDLVSRLGSI